VIDRAGVELPQVCYHPQLGPIQTCDTCLVEIDGELVRACATPVSQDMSVRTTTKRAQSARTEAFDRILTNHLLYFTVCTTTTATARCITPLRCWASSTRSLMGTAFMRHITQRKPPNTMPTSMAAPSKTVDAAVYQAGMPKA
jgi:formate dehydrogenase major subunit